MVLINITEANSQLVKELFYCDLWHLYITTQHVYNFYLKLLSVFMKENKLTQFKVITKNIRSL